MPPLTDVELPPIRAATATGHPMHPSPTRDMLALERMSARELGYWGAQFGVDVPYYITPTGWGEWLVVGVDTSGPVEFMVLADPQTGGG